MSRATDDRVPVCIFAKPPVAGTVKTRLASKLGVDLAAALAKAFLQDTWELVRGLPWARPILATTEARTEVELPGVEIWLQGEGDLGDRLERILGRALAEGKPAIAIGSDTPGLPAALLEDARQALAGEDAAVGPARDGGFYLLGLNRCPDGLLRGLPWSTTGTREALLARISDFGIFSRILAPWSDVDRPEDLDELARAIGDGVVAAPHTARALARIKERGRSR